MQLWQCSLLVSRKKNLFLVSQFSYITCNSCDHIIKLKIFLKFLFLTLPTPNSHLNPLLVTLPLIPPFPPFHPHHLQPHIFFPPPSPRLPNFFFLDITQFEKNIFQVSIYDYIAIFDKPIMQVKYLALLCTKKRETPT